MSSDIQSSFVSCLAKGKDWREIVKKVIEDAQSQGLPHDDYTLGFLYITDHLAEDAEGIVNFLRSALKVEHWIGTVGVAICGSGEAVLDTPALSMMVTDINPDDFCLLSHDQGEIDAPDLKEWSKTNTPMLSVLHGSPMSDVDPGINLKKLEEDLGGFIIGGLSSSRNQHFQFAGGWQNKDLSGAVFSDRIAVATTLSQGCTKIGHAHTITRAEDQTIREIDDKKAVEIFEQDLRQMAIRRIGRDPDKIMVEEGSIENPSDLPEELQPLFKGEVHAALPVAGSDKGGYLVRNIIGLDPDEGSMMIAETVATGDRIIFVHRDNDAIQKDLSKELVELRGRVEREQGMFNPKGALYISCAARVTAGLAEQTTSEMALVKEILGDIPITGFYAGGEIYNARLYGYTGILTLFL